MSALDEKEQSKSARLSTGGRRRSLLGNETSLQHDLQVAIRKRANASLLNH
jgi:hypothetical protein